MTTNVISVQLGEELFLFHNFDNWCDTAKRKFRDADVQSVEVICLDTKGRICGWGKHFMDAARDGTFPVRAYRVRALDEALKA